jgi:hypothetical protein
VSDRVALEGDVLGRRTRMDPVERRARNRCHYQYLQAALQPTSAAVFDDVTVAELKRMARDWTEENWTEYVD